MNEWRDPEPGVSLALARERARALGGLHYESAFDIPESPAEPVIGRARIGLTIAESSGPLILDFGGRLLSATVSGLPLEVGSVNGHLIVPSHALTPGPTTIDLAFVPDDAPLNRQEDALYTLFVPARAQLAFPCFDQPDLKASFALTLTLPEGWLGVANMPEISRSAAQDRVSIQYRDTPPLPTYLFAFAAGRFVVESAGRKDRGLRLIHREQEQARVARNLEAIVDLHSFALEWLEQYTGLPHPFDKLDLVLLPSFQFSGMEHPGAIYYNAGALFLEESATEHQELARAMLIAHEVSHLWFGDLVTMRWFDDVWLKEVFANLMAAKIVAVRFPSVNHELRFLLSHYPPAYSVDRTAGTHAIRQPLDNLRHSGSLYGPIIYHKAPIVVRELEALMTPDRFREAVRQYLREYAFDNAEWTDLVRILAGRTPLDIAAWSRTNIEQAGRPGIDTPVDLTRLPYGDIVLSPAVRHSVLDSNGQQDDPVQRGAGWIVLWEELLEARLPARDFLAALERALATERVEQIVQLLATYLKELFWRLLPVAVRQAAASRLENLLQEQIDRSQTPTLKVTYFSSLRSVFTTPGTVALLERVWRGKERLPGIVLSETEQATLALELSTRGIGRDVLDEQCRRFSDTDRRARFEFVMAAASDAKRRDTFFAALTDVSNRRHEPWVNEGLAYLNHPLRAGSAEKYLRPSLDLLEEIERTGDIFFPANWLEAAFHGHRTASAAAAVRGYVSDRPDLPDRLRRLVLQKADPLFRASARVDQ